MKKPNKTLRALGAGRMNVKYHAHALTLFAVFWSLPSGIVILVLVLAYRENGGHFNVAPGSSIAGVCGVLMIPAVHLWSIIAAIYYWCTERKRRVTVLHTEGDVSAD